jgi:hypothetical protein
MQAATDIKKEEKSVRGLVNVLLKDVENKMKEKEEEMFWLGVNEGYNHGDHWWDVVNTEKEYNNFRDLNAKDAFEYTSVLSRLKSKGYGSNAYCKGFVIGYFDGFLRRQFGEYDNRNSPRAGKIISVYLERYKKFIPEAYPHAITKIQELLEIYKNNFNDTNLAEIGRVLR